MAQLVGSDFHPSHDRGSGGKQFRIVFQPQRTGDGSNAVHLPRSIEWSANLPGSDQSRKKHLQWYLREDFQPDQRH